MTGMVIHSSTQIEESIFVNGERYSHTQLEEDNMSPLEVWNRKVGRKHEGNMQGLETPLGHSYSIILEELAMQALDTTPNPQGFVDYINGYLRKTEAYKSNLGMNLSTPSVWPDHTTPMIFYMKEKGLNSAGITKVLADIVGPDFQPCAEESIEKGFKLSYLDIINFSGDTS